MSTPLFVLLRTAFFNAFAAGHKRVEFHPYGPRWNERTCAVGRRVVLRHGHSGRRLHGHVSDLYVSTKPKRSAEWRVCYGDTGPLSVACIVIAIHGKESQ
jgi:hypothetical protein